MKKRDISFSPDAFKEFQDWQRTNPKIAKKIFELAAECTRTPFEGTGKPEGLKHNLKEYWSRRITDEHRLIYKVEDDKIYIIACHGHYSQ